MVAFKRTTVITTIALVAVITGASAWSVGSYQAEQRPVVTDLTPAESTTFSAAQPLPDVSYPDITQSYQYLTEDVMIEPSGNEPSRQPEPSEVLAEQSPQDSDTSSAKAKTTDENSSDKQKPRGVVDTFVGAACRILGC